MRNDESGARVSGSADRQSSLYCFCRRRLEDFRGRTLAVGRVVSLALSPEPSAAAPVALLHARRARWSGLPETRLILRRGRIFLDVRCRRRREYPRATSAGSLLQNTHTHSLSTCSLYASLSSSPPSPTSMHYPPGHQPHNTQYTV